MDAPARRPTSLRTRPEAASREWRPVVGEPLYEVSSDGLVWSTRSRRVLRTFVQRKGGHLRVELNGDIIRKHLVHVLVARAFLGQPPEGHQVCHNDGDPTHNHVNNLRYGTASENMRDKVLHGNHPLANKTHGDCGHELKAPNLVAGALKRGGRNCRACGCGRMTARRLGITNPDAIRDITDHYYVHILRTGAAKGAMDGYGGSRFNQAAA